MITALFTQLWARIWPYLAGVGAIIAAAFTIRQSGKRAGREQVEREQADAASEQRRRINEVDSKVSKMADDDVRRRLNDWVQRDRD